MEETTLYTFHCVKILPERESGYNKHGQSYQIILYTVFILE